MNEIISKKVLFVGPMPAPITGQSIAFSNYVNNTRHIKYVVNTNYEMKSVYVKVINTLISLAKAILTLYVYKIDVVYITTSRSLLGSIKDICIIALSRLRNVKIITHLHGADFKSFRAECPSVYRNILDWAYNKIDISIILSDGMREQYSDYDNMNIRVISNCYDPILEKCKYPKDYHRKLRIVYLSNIMSTKGIIELVCAVKQAIAKGISVHLKIAGNYMSDELMTKHELIKALNNYWCEYIDYIGVVCDFEKVKLLEWADILSLPTYYKSEAQPLCLIEGMAAGCVIISTKHNYISDLVDDSNGILIKPGSINELLDAIIFISKNNSWVKRTQEHNIRFARENYSLYRYVYGIDAIIDDV